MPFSVEHIDHVEVFVQDIEAAARWYEQVLGLKKGHRWNPEPLMIAAGDTKLALFQGNSADPQSAGHHSGWHRVAWRTTKEGFVHAQDHLRQNNIVFRGPVDHGISHSIYFLDPDGNALEITYYLSA